MSPNIHTFKNLDAFMTSEVLDQVDVEIANQLFELIMRDDVSRDELAKSISVILESIDWPTHSEEIGTLVSVLLPVEELVPEIYSEWREIVKESVAYIVGHLSPDRIIPKLVNQIVEPDKPVEQRLIDFIAQMPTLQKLGQVIARNRNLNPEFRDQLKRLENSIRDVDPKAVFDSICEQIGDRFEPWDIKMEEVIHSEASVAAVVRFSYQGQDSQERLQGVLKVLKPGIAANFWEEISILDGLVDHLNAKCHDSVFLDADFHEIVDEIREHLVPELDLSNEQRHLLAAAVRYEKLSGVRIPKLIPELCTDTITAMSFEKGCKVTEAYPVDQFRRMDLARTIVEALVSFPLFGSNAAAVIHADPHAGNLFVDEETNELVLLDWALTEDLSPEERRQIVLLVSSFSLRDDVMACQAIANLSERSIDKNPEERAIVKRLTRAAIERLPLFGVPAIGDVMGLVDEIALKGIRFSCALLVFRKALMTIEGVLNDLVEGSTLEPAMLQYLGKGLIEKAVGLGGSRFPLSSTDGFTLLCSSQWLGLRIQLNSVKKIFGNN